MSKPIQKKHINDVIDELTEAKAKFVIKALMASGRIYEGSVSRAIELSEIVKED